MKASFFCCTYRRPRLLEQAVSCFLAQEWDGEKEMVIVNDEPEQKIVFDHPEVIIVNLPERVPHLAGKHNIAASMCTGDLLFPTDDDDLYGPRRIINAAEGLQDGIYKTSLFYLDTDPVRLADGSIHCCYAFTPKMLIRSGAYHETRGRSYDQRLTGMLNFYMARRGLKCRSPQKPQYLYRTQSVKAMHHSQAAKMYGQSGAMNAASSAGFEPGIVRLDPGTPFDWSSLPDIQGMKAERGVAGDRYGIESFYMGIERQG